MQTNHVEVVGIRCTNNLKAKREGSGYSIRKLEQLSGVSNSHISQIENNQQQPSLETAYRLAKALKCDIFELFEFHE